MKLVSFACPCCGATIKSDISGKKIKCEYCEKEIYVDDEFQRIILSPENIRNLADEINRSTVEAQNKGADPKLISGIRELRDAIENSNSLKNELDSKKNRLNYISDLRKKQILPMHLIPWAACLIMMFISIQMLRYSTVFIPIKSLLFLTGVVINVISFRIISHRMRRIVDNLDKIIKRTEIDIADITKKIKEYDSVPRDMIPERYQYVMALDYIYDAFVGKRAFTIQQAINLYEEKRYNDRMAELHEQELYLTKRQLEELKLLKTQNEQMRKVNQKNALGEFALIGGSVAIMAAVAKKIKDEIL